jgi:tetratricopeptide (TPR) repeat protein
LQNHRPFPRPNLRRPAARRQLINRPLPCRNRRVQLQRRNLRRLRLRFERCRPIGPIGPPFEPRPPAQIQAARDLARRADQAMQSRDYDSAIRLYQSAVDTDPDNTDLVKQLSDARAAKSRAEDAAAQILGSRAPALADDERAKLFAQADALVAAKLFDQAIAIYDQILAKEPGNATAHKARRGCSI